jgi:myo-inositol-1(or 4)-monophosphatase
MSMLGLPPATSPARMHADRSILSENRTSPSGDDDMTADLQNFVESAQEAARRAAEVLRTWRKKFQVREKGRFDLVTDADVASQKAIHGLLADRYPDHAFLGEEEVIGHKALDSTAPTWIVDPIDGTTNYVHDCPFYCISIGLQLDGELQVGVVYDPARDEMFAAAKGQGAWLNRERLKTSDVDGLKHALLSTGFPPDLRGHEMTLDWWRWFSYHTQAMRRTGSTALNLAYVAAGRFDAYYAFDNKVWDVAGGTVLVREAGGVVSNIDGSAYDPYTPDALATNGPLHPLMLEIFRKGPNAK